MYYCNVNSFVGPSIGKIGVVFNDNTSSLPQNPAMVHEGKTFDEYGFDASLVEALADMGFKEPTNIQVSNWRLV